jgi:hypothetical protein
MVGIVMEQHQLLHSALPRHSHRFLPSGMPVAFETLVLFRRVLGVVNQNVGALCVFSKDGVQPLMPVFAISGVHDGSAVGFDAIAARSLRMVERKRANRQIAEHNL